MSPRNYGSMVLHGDTWHIAAEAHVMMKLRRVFIRAEFKLNAMELRDGDEVCKDLLWFMERYPLAVEPANRAHLIQRATAHDRRAEQFAGLLSGRMEPKEVELALPMRHYQKVAADLSLRVPGLLIADELGLGKTVMGIGAIVDTRARPALVVTMPHLLGQWQREFTKFAPKLVTHIIEKASPYDVLERMRKSRKDRKRLIEKKGQLSLIEPEFPDVLIINYHKLSGWRHTLAGIMHLVVFDEIQELRHQGSDKYQAAEHISHAAMFRVGLSATPIFNYGSEFYSVIRILSPDALGTQPEFIREWCGNHMDMRGRGRIGDPKSFGTYLREQGIMIRRTRRDVGRELPALTRSPQYVESDEKLLDKVKSSVVDLARFLLERQGSTFDRMKAGGELDWKLRQATGLAKAVFVAEFTKMIVECGEKVVLYGWHHAVYAVWKERFKQAGIKTVFFTGEESVTQKEKARQEFVEGDAQIFVMSLRAGAGLDGLQQVCRTVVVGELDWSPAVHEQCIGRVHRDGQPDPVVAYFLVSEEGSDPVIADVLGLKKAQIEGVRDPDAELIESAEPPENGIRLLAESVLRSQGIDPFSIIPLDKPSSDGNIDVSKPEVAEKEEEGG